MINFLGKENTFKEFETATFVILPVPYEFSTSYGKGTNSGPETILGASPYLEIYDEEFDVEPYKNGIYTAPAVTVADNPESTLQNIESAVQYYIKEKKFLIVLGGEHSITQAIFSAYNKNFKNLSVLQFDAHADLRDSYEGSRYSHASVMKRIWEQNPHIVQYGIRAVSREEKQFLENNDIKTYFSHQLQQNDYCDEVINNLTDNVFITIDVDYFDPSVMPATGTPEPGGFNFFSLIKILSAVFENKNVVGCDIVEFSPIPGLIFPEFTMAKLVHKIMAIKIKKSFNFKD